MNAENFAKIMETIETTSSFVIGEYIHYYTYTSLFLVAAGLFVCLVGYRIKPDAFDCNEFFIFVKYCTIIVGFVLVICNMGDFISPEAAAIHQLLTDLKG